FLFPATQFQVELDDLQQRREVSRSVPANPGEQLVSIAVRGKREKTIVDRDGCGLRSNVIQVEPAVLYGKLRLHLPQAQIGRSVQEHAEVGVWSQARRTEPVLEARIRVMNRSVPLQKHNVVWSVLEQ